MHISNGILFNHESPLRGGTFVTKKITMAVARISLGLQKKLTLGNLDAKRDWGHSEDYVEGMWLMLQQEEPDDYVLATNKAVSVREFVEKAFSVVHIEIAWQGSGIEEVGINKKNGQTLVRVDPRYFRPTEVDYLLGDYSKAKEKLGWEPRRSLDQLVEEMVQYDLQEINKV